jgi:hypothetical protein
MDWSVFWNDLLRHQPITGVTINTVLGTAAARDAIAVVAGLAFAAGCIAFVAFGRRFGAAVRLAGIAAFFAAGLAAAAHGDRTWSGWVAADWRQFGGRTTEEKLRVQNGPLYAFAVKARQVIPSEYMIPNDGSDNYLARRFEYFALPKRKRPQADYVVVVGDHESRFDQAKRTYARGSLVIPDVELVLQAAQDAYVLKKMK